MPFPTAAFAACLPGLEPLLVDELTQLGTAPRAVRGGAEFPADVPLLMRCGLWLGTASHVVVRLATFRCRALGELERKARELPWADWLRPNVPVRIDATSRRSRLFHTGAIAERIGNAIADNLGAPPPATPDGDGPLARLTVRLHDDVCTLSLDTASTPLHRRGYRLQTAKAPLREDIAHALVLAAKVPAGAALLDPFCGSGTIAIEAASLSQGLPPGRLRPPPLEHLAAFDPGVWERVRTAPPPITPTARRVAASDRDAGAIGAARENAARAGVGDAIEFACAAVRAQPWFAEPSTAPAAGRVVTNPPFGLRVRGGQDLLPLYQTLGRCVAALGPAWSLAMVAHDGRLARGCGLPLRAAFTTKHGGLSVTALVAAAPAEVAQ